MGLRKLVVAATLSMLAGAASAGELVRVESAWVRATVPGQKVAGAYMKITSPAAAKLVKVESPVGTAEIHTMTIRNGVMEMRRIESLDLPAGQTVQLAPGENHIMLSGLKSPLKAGSKVPLTLSIDTVGNARLKVQVQADVRAPGAARP